MNKCILVRYKFKVLYNFILQYFTFYSTKSYSSFCGATSQLARCRSSYLQDTEPDCAVSILIKGLERPWREKDITLHLWFNTRARKLYQINGVRRVYCWRTHSYDQTLWIRLIKVYFHIKFLPKEVSEPLWLKLKYTKKKQKKIKTHKVKYGCKAGETPQLPHEMLVTAQVRHWLTEHGFEPNQAADEAVEVDVHVLVCVAHGDDVVQLVVETEAWAGHKTHDCTVTRTFRGWVQAVGSSAAHTELKPSACLKSEN